MLEPNSKKTGALEPEFDPEIGPEIDMGPLARLMGIWEGKQGRDIAPEPDGIEDNAYYERIEFQLTRRVSNAEEQKLAALQYRQLVRRVSNDKILHDQSGYWAWDAQGGSLMHMFSIPRGVTVLAGGTVTESSDGSMVFEVRSSASDPHWTISEAPFMQRKAKTLEFNQRLVLGGDELHYAQTTLLDIYGREFEHTDENRLARL